MNDRHVSTIAEELGIADKQATAVASLLEGGATVPFIARYRKEATGSLDEVAITEIRDRLTRMQELDDRREAIVASLVERNLLTDELKKKIEAAAKMTELEDIYLPYRPKRRTRATIAREKGLEPLARLILDQDPATDLEKEAASYVNADKEVASAEDALAGARDIISEWVSEDQDARVRIRGLFSAKGIFRTKVIADKETEAAKYRDYFDWEEAMATAPSHRVLAMRRGAKEGFLSLRVIAPEEDAQMLLEALFVKGQGACSEQVRSALQDGYKRLLAPSMETEFRLETKKRADEEAIKVFADNLRQLLMASPLGQKSVLAIDPGFRTGCKTVCLDPQGKLLHNETIHPLFTEEGKADGARRVMDMCKRFGIEAIAVGNGTAGRETEAFVRGIGLPPAIAIVMVNESGASIYSASDVAREEFPEQDVTVRGAVSIGRRLMDPLAELVKIDPKSIGVGQYQHDVDQKALKQSLDDVVVNSVNGVGVDVNTASVQLLTYVSGIGSNLARNIVRFRDENGPFPSRDRIKKVPLMGPKAFEQSAGFLRVRSGENPLDSSAVHPESYGIVESMAKDLDCRVNDLMTNADLRKRINIERYLNDSVGIPTLTDILAELARPGRDPRKEFELFSFSDKAVKLEDLTPGLKLPGIVTNVTAFGAFVDVGVHQDGLVHISQLSDNFVKVPNDVVKVQQKVTVTVLEVDIERRRISLSMKTDPFAERPTPEANKDQPEKKGPSGPKKPGPKQKPGAKKDDRSSSFNTPFAALLKKGK